MCALVVTHKMSPEADRCLLCVWGVPGKFFYIEANAQIMVSLLHGPIILLQGPRTVSYLCSY